MFQTIFARVHAQNPLVHCITNYVTANDCANMLLACGASPIMADEPEEAAEITALCGALAVNLGTLSRRTIPAMLAAAGEARRLGRPAVLDPVGAGASRLRTETALTLLERGRFTVIRGNISEIRALARCGGGTRGVDAAAAERVTEENLDRSAAFVRDFAGRTGSVVAATGAIDLVASGERVYCIRGGHPDMGGVTGAGCQLSALTAAFLAANPDRPLEAATAAVCAMDLCGEIAHRRLTAEDGSGTYRAYILDAMWNLTPERLEQEGKYEVR